MFTLLLFLAIYLTCGVTLKHYTGYKTWMIMLWPLYLLLLISMLYTMSVTWMIDTFEESNN